MIILSSPLLALPGKLIFQLALLLATILCLSSCDDYAWGEVYDTETLADAIYQAEGGPKAKKPFGILSVRCEGYEACREVCINTIKNNFTRWQLAGATGDFLEFLGNRYAPPSAHPLNRFWIPNVKAILSKIDGE